MRGILKDPGIRTEAWSERMERKASGSRGKLCGDESHTTEWWGKEVSEWVSEGLESPEANSNLRTKV